MQRNDESDQKANPTVDLVRLEPLLAQTQGTEGQATVATNKLDGDQIPVRSQTLSEPNPINPGEGGHNAVGRTSDTEDPHH